MSRRDWMMGLALLALALVLAMTARAEVEVDHDREVWQSAEKCGTTACFQAYLEDYPNGRYAKMARARLKTPEPASSTPAAAVGEPSRQAFEPEMVAITSGCFQMGSPESERGRGSDEKQHRVCVGNVEMGRYEVTQQQWQAVMGSNPSYFTDCANCPVEQVSFHDIQDYLRQLSQRTGKTYRLPTEAEWEYACRGGVAGEAYCGGHDPDRLAWHKENSGGKTHPVGQQAANRLGLYDMSGNVWEWTCSLYDEGYGGTETECGNNNNTDATRVVRGGSWDTDPAWVRSAMRSQDKPVGSDYLMGFRLARSL